MFQLTCPGKQCVKNDVLSGLTVALALVPEAVAFADARVYDHSGLEATDNLAERYMRRQRTLHIRHLNQECQNLLVKAGDLVDVNMMEDPTYRVADDRVA